MLALDRLGLGRDPLQHANDVHVGFALHAMPFPIAGLARLGLPQNADVEFRNVRCGMAVIARVYFVRRVSVGSGLHEFPWRF